MNLDSRKLLERISALGKVGRDDNGCLCRIAASDADQQGRDLFTAWLKQAALRVEIDRVGNIYGIWEPMGSSGNPVVLGSHIDTVMNAGIYDGCYGVLSGLAVIEAMQEAQLRPKRPIAVVAFTNEEGVRFTPDMMGSLVTAGGLSVEEALAASDINGSILGAELQRIGYAGSQNPGFLRPHAYVELHIEQGPVLEREGISIAAVESLQGISWQRITIRGIANHAGTTPMTMRSDAGVAASSVVLFLRDLALSIPGGVATVGTMLFEPDAINIIPASAIFTVDLRHPDEAKLLEMEDGLKKFLRNLAHGDIAIEAECLSRFTPVVFDPIIVGAIEVSAAGRKLLCRRMVSGAGHDAQMIARIAPTAMIFVPSRGGISHNPAEFTDENDLIAGATVLLDVASKLSL